MLAIVPTASSEVSLSRPTWASLSTVRPPPALAVRSRVGVGVWAVGGMFTLRIVAKIRRLPPVPLPWLRQHAGRSLHHDLAACRRHGVVSLSRRYESSLSLKILSLRAKRLSDRSAGRPTPAAMKESLLSARVSRSMSLAGANLPACNQNN